MFGQLHAAAARASLRRLVGAGRGSRLAQDARAAAHGALQRRRQLGVVGRPGHVRRPLATHRRRRRGRLPTVVSGRRRRDRLPTVVSGRRPRARRALGAHQLQQLGVRGLVDCGLRKSWQQGEGRAVR